MTGESPGRANRTSQLMHGKCNKEHKDPIWDEAIHGILCHDGGARDYLDMIQTMGAYRNKGFDVALILYTFDAVLQWNNRKEMWEINMDLVDAEAVHFEKMCKQLNTITRAPCLMFGIHPRVDKWRKPITGMLPLMNRFKDIAVKCGVSDNQRTTLSNVDSSTLR